MGRGPLHVRQPAQRCGVLGLRLCRGGLPGRLHPDQLLHRLDHGERRPGPPSNHDHHAGSYTTTKLPPFECPSGWVDANPGCFRLEFNSSLTRHDALLLCESVGGFLAEPKNQDQVDMLAGLAQLEFDILGLDSWWIGLTDQGHEGRWVWEHSFTEADFTDWADGFPTAEDNVADCAVMSHDQGWKWVDMACGEGLATAICQMDEA